MTRLLVVEPGYCPYQAGFPSAMAAASGNTVSDADLTDTTTQIDALADGASLSMQSDIFSAQAGVIGGLTIIAVSASE